MKKQYTMPINSINREAQSKIKELEAENAQVYTKVLGSELEQRIKELETENAESWVDADKYDNQQERIKELEAQLEKVAELGRWDCLEAQGHMFSEPDDDGEWVRHFELQAILENKDE